MRPRVQRAPGLPCALCISGGEAFLQKLRAEHAARTIPAVVPAFAGTTRGPPRPLSRHCEECSDEAIHLAAKRKMDCFATLAMTWIGYSRSLNRHCEERKRRGNPSHRAKKDGLLRCARNDAERQFAALSPSLRGAKATKQSIFAQSRGRRMSQRWSGVNCGAGCEVSGAAASSCSTAAAAGTAASAMAAWPSALGCTAPP
jgi:hypothetical protein